MRFVHQGIESAFECGKCGENTTIAESQAAGARNPLKRNCNECIGFDKALKKQPDVFKSFQKMDVNAKKTAYKDEKKKRKELGLH